MANGPDLNHDLYMAIALLVSQRSQSSEQVGACIVNAKNQIVGIGYNTTGSSHAELTAILQSTQETENCTLYVTLHPCNECAETIIQSRIKRVFYYDNKYPDTKSPKLLEKYGIPCVEYDPGIKIYINFRNVGTEINEREESNESLDISWEHFFMATAYLVAKINNNSSVGACIVNDNNQIVSFGYMRTTPQQNSSKSDDKKGHAERGAILNASQSLKDCTLYVSVFPCNECATYIIQSGIKKVIYNYDKFPCVAKDLQHNGIDCIYYIPPFDLIIE